MKTSDFDYDLPEERIAQAPSEVRDECKLLVLDKETGKIEDRIFKDIVSYVNPGDVLVANETRVMPARIIGSKKDTGGVAEIFLLREDLSRGKKTNQVARWEALVRPGRRLKPGAVVQFFNDNNEVILEACIVDWCENAHKGERIVELRTQLASVNDALHLVGKTPLPPYIKDYTGDKELYQTVYSTTEKSAAAPTAGLHFTPELIKRIKHEGAFFETVELQVGLDTFRIVDEEYPEDHAIHTETYTVSQKVIDSVNKAHENGNKVIAVGTTSVRSLESAWDARQKRLLPQHESQTSLYILPGYKFKAVDAIITNFHVPRSTLMMLVSAFSSTDKIMKAYKHAIESEYRMLSFGDAMYIK